jgi:acyl dehydratase
VNGTALYLEDLVPGAEYTAPQWPVAEADVIRFGQEFDPQPFHVDAAAAAQSLFGGLAASGWHTSAMMMGMATRSELNIVNGIIGLGVEALRFPRAVRPGDTLRLLMQILEVRRSGSTPSHGIVKCRWQAFNQHGELVAEMLPRLWVQARQTSAGEPAKESTDVPA